MSAAAITCPECGADRIRRWEAMRRRNGLTEAEWPKPAAPEFDTPASLARHRRERHGVR